MEKIYSVTELHSKLENHIEGLFPFVWIQGEVANFSRSSSGHLYFSLKDTNAVINCVWFFSKQRHHKDFDILTGEILEEPQECISSTIQNGDMLYCAGSITLYKSSHQLIIDLVEYIGEGLLHREYMLLKIDLDSMGAFSLERKSPLPKHIQRIALITALHGAAIQDFLTLLNERGRGSEITVYDVTVQGERASSQVSNAIYDANRKNWADIIIVMRGGGANEDLSIFNSREIAEAILSSRIHILAAIGHEIDYSFADMIADTRAATPSHAAQLLWKTRSEEYEYLFSLKEKLNMVFYVLIEQYTQKMRFLLKTLMFLSPEVYVLNKEFLLRDKQQKLAITLSQIIQKYTLHVNYTKKFLIDNSPLYKIQELEEKIYYLKNILKKSIFLYLEKQEISLSMFIKRLECLRFSNIILQKNIFFVQKLQRLHRGYQEYILFYENLIKKLEYRLDSNNPELFWTKGYVKLKNLDETRILSLSDIQEEKFRIEGKDFSLLVHILEVEYKGRR